MDFQVAVIERGDDDIQRVRIIAAGRHRRARVGRDDENRLGKLAIALQQPGLDPVRLFRSRGREGHQ